MTEETSRTFVDCLEDALETFSKADSQLREFNALLDQVEPEKLAQCVTTPAGRAFLRGGINTAEGRAWLLGQDYAHAAEEGEEIKVRECDILRWAFTAELMQFGIPFKKAASFVAQGITLRDIKSRPVEELAEQRWALVPKSKDWALTPRPIAEFVADRLEEEHTLKDHLDEQWIREWLLDEFFDLKQRVIGGETGHENGQEVISFLGHEMALHEFETPVRELTKQFISNATADGVPFTEAVAEHTDVQLLLSGMASEPEWTEFQVKEWLRGEFLRLKGKIERAELEQLDLSRQEIDALIAQRIGSDQIKFRPAEELAEQLFNSALREDGLSYADVTQQMVLQVRREQGKSGEPFAVAMKYVVDELPNQYQGFPFIEAIPGVMHNPLVEEKLEGISLSITVVSEYQARQFANFVIKRGLFLKVYHWKKRIEHLEKTGRDLFPIRFYDLLVVSDFHIAAGNHPSPEGIARLSPTEDFYFDDAFFRFLHYCEKERRQRGGHPYELVFNGDMIDFAQVVVPNDPEKKPFIPWPLPRLFWEELAVPLENEIGAKERLLPKRLFTILKEVHEENEFSEAVYKQVELLESAGERKRADFLGWLLEGDGDDWTYEEESGEEYEEDPDFEELDGWTEQDWDDWAYEEEPWGGPGAGDDYTGEEWESRDMTQLKVLAMGRGEALDQLADVYRGHRRLFQGLAWFLAQGNRLIVIRGNHDPQWYWPEVQLAFIGWLKEAYTELQRACNDPTKCELPVPAEELRNSFPEMTLEDVETRVDFDHCWYYYRDRLAYLEHGGQQEALDAHRYFLLPVYYSEGQEWEERGQTPSLQKASDWLPALSVSPAEREIEPPLGSLGQVFFINNLESQFPNFDRPGYSKAYFDYLQYRDLRLLGYFVGAVRRTLIAITKWALGPLRDLRLLKQLGVDLLNWRSKQHGKKLEAYARLTGLPTACVEELDTTKWVRRWRLPSFGQGFVFLAALLLVLPILIALLDVAIFLGTGKNILKTLFPGKPAPMVVSLIVEPFLLGLGLYWAKTLASRFVNLGEDYLLKPSQRVARILQKHKQDVPYILFGHDHVRNAQRLRLGERDRAALYNLFRRDPTRKTQRPRPDPWYLNTGAWLHKYAKERKRLLREPLEYSFVRMFDTHRVLASGPDDYMTPRTEARPKVELLRWNDNAGRAEPCETFKGTAEG